MATAHVLAIVLSGWALTFLLEWGLTPRPRLFVRPIGAHCIHFGTWLLLFGVLLVIVQHPFSVMTLALSFWLLVVLVNNAKYDSLKEPLVFMDLEYVFLAVRHPRLYLPFLGVSRALLYGGAFGGAAYGVWRLDLSWSAPLRGDGLAWTVAALGTAGVCLTWMGASCSSQPTLEPTTDLRRSGLAASLWLYRLAERRRVLKPVVTPFQPASVPGAERPDIVVVQSESFFDARRLFSGIRADVLANFDALRPVSIAQGRLQVPAWGANTVRTEFSFLSGLASEDLGVDRFNPYRHLARQPVATVASYLRRLGYRTVCVHPYPSTFYARDRVFPNLGFEEFVDVRSFANGDTFGPYVSDASVTTEIIRSIAEGDRPTFVFAITMENHGPLNLEFFAPDEAADYLVDGPPPSSLHDLTVYLRHLKNADRMIGALRDWLGARSRPGHVCFYGDHVPIMPRVYETVASHDGRTEYVIWSNRQHSGDQGKDAPVEMLGPLLLRTAGLIPSHLPGIST